MAERAWGIVFELGVAVMTVPAALGVAAVNKFQGGEFTDGGLMDAVTETAGAFGDRHADTIKEVVTDVGEVLYQAARVMAAGHDRHDY